MTSGSWVNNHCAICTLVRVPAAAVIAQVKNMERLLLWVSVLASLPEAFAHRGKGVVKESEMRKKRD